MSVFDSLAKSGATVSEGLTAGTYQCQVKIGKTGTSTYVDQETGENVDSDWVTFNATIYDAQGNKYFPSGIASVDTTLTRKFMKWSLAMNGLLPEQVDPKTFDLRSLAPSGEAIVTISYEVTRRNKETGKNEKVKSEFPSIVDIQPLPNSATPRQPLLTNGAPF